MTLSRLIIGAHAIIYSRKPAADRAFLRDILGLSHVDAGEGWLIFGMPPAEMAIHPGAKNNVHELYFMCTDVEAFVRAATAKGVSCGPLQRNGWGELTKIRLPGEGQVGVYHPRHARPSPRRQRAPSKLRPPRMRTAA